MRGAQKAHKAGALIIVNLGYLNWYQAHTPGLKTHYKKNQLMTYITVYNLGPYILSDNIITII